MAAMLRVGSLWMLPGALVVAIATAALGQATVQPDVKAPAFDVVSIKPSHSPDPGGAWGVSTNKYVARNTSLVQLLLNAYLGTGASTDLVKGAPSWVMTEPYNVVAKADDETAASWKGLRQAQQMAIVAPMLRAMLEDRCKLVAHTEPTEVPGYELIIGKHGMKMREATPGEPMPSGTGHMEGGWGIRFKPPAPDGSRSATYLQISMAQFVAFLSMGGPPILDKTGLTGKYDFDLPILWSPAEGEERTRPTAMPSVPQRFDWGSLGLEVRPIKVPALHVVVEHIERPTAN